VAADVLCLTRTFTLAATIDIDQNSGTQASPIRVIGYNYNSGSPIIDGTFSLLDGNSAATNCVLGNNINSWIWENIEFKKANEDNVGVAGADCDSWSFINCHSHHAGQGGVTGDGWGSTNAIKFNNASFSLCRAYSNLVFGFYTYHAAMFGCTSYDNGDDGYYSWYSMHNNCVSYSNGDHGFYLLGSEQSMMNCVSDGNVDSGIYFTDGPLLLIGSRITNNAFGVRGDGTATVIDLYNFFKGNATLSSNCTLISTVRGVNTRTTTGNEGYVNRSAGNFALLDTAAARRTEVEL
jgi:hypothetical protein